MPLHYEHRSSKRWQRGFHHLCPLWGCQSWRLNVRHEAPSCRASPLPSVCFRVGLVGP